MSKETFDMQVVEHRGRRLFFHHPSGRAVAEIPLAGIQRRTPLTVRRDGRAVHAKFFKHEMQAAAPGLAPGDRLVLRITRSRFERVTFKSMDAAIDNHVIDERGRRIIAEMRPMFGSEEEMYGFVDTHRGKTLEEILELAKSRKPRR